MSQVGRGPGWGIVTPALVQPGRYGADPATQPYGHDVQKAVGVIEGAGIPNKEVLVLVSPEW